MKAKALLAIFVLISAGFSSLKTDILSFTSVPTRLHIHVESGNQYGNLFYPSTSKDYPQFSACPRFKVGLVPVVNGTQVYGTTLNRITTYDDFSSFLSRYAPNLRLIQMGEEYSYFSGGQINNAASIYGSLATTSVTPEQAKQRTDEALGLKKVDWTIAASDINFEKIKVYAFPDQNKSVSSIFSDPKVVASGQVLDELAQGFFPKEGFTSSNLDFTVCQPYTSIPVLLPQDNFLDFKFRPVGTNYEETAGEYIPKSASEPATWVHAKLLDVQNDNMTISEGFDGVRDITASFKVRYTNDFRFDYQVDPPEIMGVANLPLVSANYGIASMYEDSGKQHLVQGFTSLSKFYKWMPQTNTGYSEHKLLVRPAVFERIMHESKLWELSHFRVTFPTFSVEDGKLTTTETFTDVEPVRFEEISQGVVAYFTFTNIPWLETAPSTFFIPEVDRPYRIQAVYEPGELSARGKQPIAESTRMKLFWGVTPQMKQLAKTKESQYGKIWWQKAFPTFYTVTIRGDIEKKIEKINPLFDSVIVEGLTPGQTYKWELQTFVSDSIGSPTLQQTWYSEPISTKPFPMLVGHCGQTSAVKVKTTVDENGDENWVLSVPMLYELGGAKLQPLRFLSRPVSVGHPVPLGRSKMFRVVKEKDGISYMRAYIKVVDFYDAYERNEKHQNVIHLEFEPLEIKVEGECVNEFTKSIGYNPNGVNTYWPARDSSQNVLKVRIVETPLLIKGSKLYRFKQWKWVGSIFAVRSPFFTEQGTAVLVASVNGCQDDPEKPVKPKIFAVYEEIEPECYSVTTSFAIDWKIEPVEARVPVSPAPDCPGDNTKYFAGTSVRFGPTPDEITFKGLQYKFVGWIIGDQVIPGKKTISLTVDKGYVVVANYQPKEGKFVIDFYADLEGRRYRLDVKINPSPDPNDGLYKAGTIIRIGPVPHELDEGRFRFIGFAVDGELQITEEFVDTIDFVVDGTHRITAVYAIKQ